MDYSGTSQDNAGTAGNGSSDSLTREELLALIPQGSRVEYATADKSICVVHSANGEVVAILSDRASGPVARRARLIACIPRLLVACSDAALEEVAACVAKESDHCSALWWPASRSTPPTKP